ncbi:MAG: hypothetical protein L6V35_04645 [Alistipes putredinis]|nr:MAG: hypothetical protein L6V35_04645 [Alistipes putredinis]
MNAAVLAIIAACAALYAAAAVRTLMYGASERSRRRRRDRLQDAYLLALAEYLSGPDAGRGEVRFPQSRGRRGKMILAEAIAAFAEMNCGYDCAAMHKIVTDNGVDAFLVRRIARSRSWNRVRYMRLFVSYGSETISASAHQASGRFAGCLRVALRPDYTDKFRTRTDDCRRPRIFGRNVASGSLRDNAPSVARIHPSRLRADDML